MSVISDIIESTKAIIKGMSVTLSYIPKGKWTVQYPDEPVTVQPRYRGQHLLHVDELGREKCVACYLCAAACPRTDFIVATMIRARPRSAPAWTTHARSTTSITGAASSAFASKPVRRTRSHMA